MHRSISRKLATSRLLNENTNLFGHVQFQMELKLHALIEAAAVMQESTTPYKTHTRLKALRRHS